MRLLLVALIIAVSGCEAASVTTKSNVANSGSGISFVSRLDTHNDSKEAERSLHRDENASDEEERGGGAEKLDEVMEKVVHASKKLRKRVSTAALEKLNDLAAKVKKVSPMRPENLSPSTLKQLDKIDEMKRLDRIAEAKRLDALPEAQRIAELAKKNPGKSTPDGMFRKMELGPDAKIAPTLTSEIGRAKQRFDDDGRRLLSCIVVSRRTEDGGGDVLLISSSNPKRDDWILPKGGWNEGEGIEKAAWRELVEEGGVNGQFVVGLGKKNVDGAKNQKFRYYMYKMQAKTVYDQWPESMRHRLWVPSEDAIKLLAGRPDMVDVVRRAQLADELAKTNWLRKEDDALAKLRFDL
ncbi:hypothetical protein KRP22_006445 [Phytophthora ramorum]|uniref:RxLR effector protein n=1 Tax=Phytophthora ramorum TaxID=164328 RepID=UPI00309A5F22|nr:RxLR effector protein [Phytophthora ramorum]KAH7507322.1 RxLR effector protein [Phytophthora ramorum]